MAAQWQAELESLTHTPVGQENLPSAAWNLGRKCTLQRLFPSICQDSQGSLQEPVFPGGNQPKCVTASRKVPSQLCSLFPLDDLIPQVSGAPANTCNRCELRNTGMQLGDALALPAWREGGQGRPDGTGLPSCPVDTPEV